MIFITVALTVSSVRHIGSREQIKIADRISNPFECSPAEGKYLNWHTPISGFLPRYVSPLPCVLDLSLIAGEWAPGVWNEQLDQV